MDGLGGLCEENPRLGYGESGQRQGVHTPHLRFRYGACAERPMEIETRRFQMQITLSQIIV
jgi:hypothetical protein